MDRHQIRLGARLNDMLLLRVGMYVDRSLKPAHGSVVVVAAVDGEMSIKRMVVEGNTARLTFNDADLSVYALEELAEVDVWGVVRF